MSDSDDENLEKLMFMRKELLNELGVEENDYFKNLESNDVAVTIEKSHIIG